MLDYISVAQISDFAEEFDRLSSSGQDLLATSASRLFDRLCGVEDNFFAVAGSSFTDKDFIGDGSSYLRLSPYTVLNSSSPVKLNNGTTAVPDFSIVNVPDHIERNGHLVVLMRPGYSEDYPLPHRFTGWPEGVQVRVSAKWGFSAIPADVQQAVIQIAINNWRRQDPAFTKLSDIDSPDVAIPIQAKEIADRYKGIYQSDIVFV